MAVADPAALAKAALQYGPAAQKTIRRSKYLSSALQALQSGEKITGGYGELVPKLLAQAILQRANTKAEDATIQALKGEQDSRSSSLIEALGGKKPEPIAPAPIATPQPSPEISPAPEPQPVMSAPLPPAQPQARAAAGPQIDPHVDAIVRTVWGEARSEGPQGQAAVAGVILNRARERGLQPRDVVLQPGQFEPWQNPKTRAAMEALTPDSPEYQAILANISPALSGQNPVGGADHFYSPGAQAALGRQPPKWDNGSGQDMGRHRFFDLEKGAPQAPPPPPPPDPNGPDIQNVAASGAGADPFPQPGGQLQPGNIDLGNRPVVNNPDGSISTVRSISIGVDGKTVLIPTVVGGRVVPDQEAIQNFRQTGQHLGVFADEPSATAYAQQLHQQQAAQYAPPSAPVSSPPGVGAPPAAPAPQAPAAGGQPAWPTWKPSQQQIGYVESLLRDPRTHDQGVQAAMKLREKMTEPVPAKIVEINGAQFYVPETPDQGGRPVMIPVPPEAMTQTMTAQAAGLPFAPQGLNVQRDPLGNLKDAPGAPPANFNAGPNGYEPIRGSAADPYRVQPPAPSYQFTGQGQQGPIQGSPADPRNVTNVMEAANRYGGMVKTIVDSAMKVKQNFGAVLTGYRQQNGPGDIAMTNGIQKLIDDGVVKGEDVQMQMKSNGLSGTLGGWQQYAQSGGLFTPDVREKIRRTAEQLYKNLDQTYRVRITSLQPGFDEVYGQGAFGKHVFPEAFAAELGWVGGGGAPEPGPAPGPAAAPVFKPGTADAGLAEAVKRKFPLSPEQVKRARALGLM